MPATDIEATPRPAPSATGMLSPDSQIVLRLQRVEDAIGTKTVPGMRGDLRELKDEMGQLRSDVMKAVGSSTLDKLLNADAKKLGILLAAGVAIVAIVYGATLGYGEWTVNAKADNDAAGMLDSEIAEE